MSDKKQNAVKTGITFGSALAIRHGNLSDGPFFMVY